MAYFADLSEYTYTWSGEDLQALNIGWLDGAFPFQIGEVDHDIISIVQNLCNQPVLIMRGIHRCDFCPHGHPACGTGEIRVVGENFKIYAAPALLHHYLAEHKYRPPEQFLQAITSKSIHVHLAEMKRWEEYEIPTSER